ncbi:mechanosensitive ion channel [Halorubellus sp. JP-L1]|uniref:mechanosensitive ion channel family protein n=1 Tax=Halorubellus sp. JP-L1 TaxID=2715753 RepID=UPI0014072EBE|nr:mechanosensitive ion channel domain-containing protein [Halorubellus sp. JP-L1]NHN42171.1 mechanosensitive ion channel [Halorubellus sp. JP-L1]
MLSVTTAAVLQATTAEGSGLGVPDLVPVLVRAGKFVAGFLLVLVLGWYVLEPAISRLVQERNADNPTIQEAISRYVRLFVVVGAVFVGAGVAGYGQFLSDSALVIAAGTLAVGVAAQTVIGSLVSGLVLVADPEFNVGNFIEWSDGQGEVQSITLRVTRVHTPDGKLQTIPNETLTSDVIARPYGRGRFRVVEHIGLAYEDDVDDALDVLEEAATELDGVLADPAPSAYVETFESDAVLVRVHYWIDDPRHRDVLGIRSAYALAVKDRLERAGVTISPASKRELQGRIEVERSEPAST